MPVDKEHYDKQIKDAEEKLAKETDPEKIKILKNRIDEIKGKLAKLISMGPAADGGTSNQEVVSWQEELELLISRLPLISDENLRKKIQKRIEDLVEAIGGGTPTKQGIVSPQNRAALNKLRQDIQKASQVPSSKKDTSKLNKQLAAATKPVKQVLPRTVFNLPQFTSDNATGIVLACILICFGLELNAGTKFVTLWNDAFSPSSKSSGSGTDLPEMVSQDHTAINAAATSSESALIAAKESVGQNVDALATSSVALSHGGGTFMEYGVPSSFHFLDGVVW